MNEQPELSSMSFSRRGSAFGLAVLTAAAVVLFVVCDVIARERAGDAGREAVLVAVGVCWFANVLALLVTGILIDAGNEFAGALSSILLRTGLPLGASAAVFAASPRLAGAGVLGWFVAAYLVMLTVETVLSVLMMNAKEAQARRS